MGKFSNFKKLWVMEIWLKFCKSKYMGNVTMGKFLKTLPITVCQYMAKYSTYGGGTKKCQLYLHN